MTFLCGFICQNSVFPLNTAKNAFKKDYLALIECIFYNMSLRFIQNVIKTAYFASFDDISSKIVFRTHPK